MGKRTKSGPFDFPAKVEDAKARTRAIALLKDKGIRLPTFTELADPATVPTEVAAALAQVDRMAPDARNLFRVHWHNPVEGDRPGRLDRPEHVVLPPALTGVESPIVLILGEPFPMITAHKVLAAYACLTPRLVSGRFDPTRQRAVWPSTGNYCRGGVATRSARARSLNQCTRWRLSGCGSSGPTLPSAARKSLPMRSGCASSANVGSRTPLSFRSAMLRERTLAFSTFTGESNGPEFARFPFTCPSSHATDRVFLLSYS